MQIVVNSSSLAWCQFLLITYLVMADGIDTDKKFTLCMYFKLPNFFMDLGCFDFNRFIINSAFLINGKVVITPDNAVTPNNAK